MKVIVSKFSKKKPVWLFYFPFDDARESSVRCMVCNAELSAKVLRWKSHHEKCPWQGRNSIFFYFFNRENIKPVQISQSTTKRWLRIFNRPLIFVLTTFLHIDRGGFNRLKPLVKTGGGFNRPTLIVDKVFRH